MEIENVDNEKEKSNDQKENTSRALLLKWVDAEIEYVKKKNKELDPHRKHYISREEIDSHKKDYSREYFEQVIRVKTQNRKRFDKSVDDAELEYWLEQQTQPYQKRAHGTQKRYICDEENRRPSLIFGDNVSSSISKVPDANADAYLSNHFFMVIADGGGACSADSNVDPSIYAQDIVFNAVKSSSDTALKSIMQVMERAWYFTRVSGGSTLIMTRIKSEYGCKILSVLNMGDSRCMVYRCNFDQIVADDSSTYGKYFARVFDADICQHSHDHPYQFGAEYSDEDTPSQAVLSEFEVKFGDIIIMCSDGLVDNVDQSAIERIVQTHFTDTNEILNALMNLAREKSQDENATDIPFRLQDFRPDAPRIGGKPDDITIIVSRVLESFSEVEQ